MYIDTTLVGPNNNKIYYNREAILDLITEATERLKNLRSKTNVKDSIIHEAFSSCILDGAKTSITKVKDGMKYIAYGGRLNNNDSTTLLDEDDRMVINTLHTLKTIYTLYKINTTDDILTLYNLLTVDLDIEPLRQHQEYYVKRLTSFINYYENNIDKGLLVHFYVLLMQPFGSNDRMGRLLQNYVLFNSGFKGIVQLNISDQIMKTLIDYQTAVDSSKRALPNGCYDITVFMRYMFKTIIKACKNIKESLTDIEMALYSQMLNNRNTKMTVSLAKTILKTDADTARNILNNLVNKGIMIKNKDGNRNVYTLIN